MATDISPSIQPVKYISSDKITVLSSDIDSLSNDISTLSSEIDTVSNSVGVLSFKVDTLSDITDSLSTTVTNLSDTTDSLSTTVTNLSDTVDSLSNTTTTLDNTKIGYAEYSDNYLMLYANNTKQILLGKLLIEGGGSPTEGISENKCREIVESYGFAVASDFYSKAILDEKFAAKADLSSIPVYLYDLTDDSTHRLVTDAEKEFWNNKVSAVMDESNENLILKQGE